MRILILIKNDELKLALTDLKILTKQRKLKNMFKKNIALILESGDTYQGYMLGDFPKKENSMTSEVFGEIIFNTSMSGYQEIITDPSYKQQIVCFTYPSIGNYGINANDHESKGVYLSGIVMKDYCKLPSNFQSHSTLDEFLKEKKIPGIFGIDTRSLVLNIREKGELRSGIFLYPEQNKITTIDSFNKWLNTCLIKVCSSKTLKGQNLTKEFRGAHIRQKIPENGRKYMKVAVLDFGIKQSIINNLWENQIRPEIFPGNTPYYKWENFNLDSYSGFFLSNGPGDPSACKHGIKNAQYLINSKKPIFGICLGHQIISMALGATTFKMKFGHHGANQPVKANTKNKISITSQNHGFSVDSLSLEKILREIKLKFGQKANIDIEKNLNDKTIEGFYINTKKYQILSVQYHPEASPGPHEARFNFKLFKKMLHR